MSYVYKLRLPNFSGTDLPLIHQSTKYKMSETEKCGFCFAEYFEMTNPRQMACGHVFCLPCMQEHYENSQGVECAFKHCR